MNIDNFRTFVAVAKVSNICQAARDMGVEKMVVYSRITALEKEVGYPLFTKSRRGSFLTKDGEIMLTAVKKIVNTYDDAIGKVEQAHASDN